SIDVRSCEEKRAAAATWCNDDPTLPGRELCVLDHLETEVPPVERDRFVIVPDEQCAVSDRRCMDRSNSLAAPVGTRLRNQHQAVPITRPSRAASTTAAVTT